MRNDYGDVWLVDTGEMEHVGWQMAHIVLCAETR